VAGSGAASAVFTAPRRRPCRGGGGDRWAARLGRVDEIEHIADADTDADPDDAHPDSEVEVEVEVGRVGA
jgi:hypothetical protein